MTHAYAKPGFAALLFSLICNLIVPSATWAADPPSVTISHFETKSPGSGAPGQLTTLGSVYLLRGE